MTIYEKRFYEDIHKIAIIQEKILKELQKMNEPIIIDKVAPKKIEKMAFMYKVQNPLQDGNNERFREFINELIDEVNKLKESE